SAHDVAPQGPSVGADAAPPSDRPAFHAPADDVAPGYGRVVGLARPLPLPGRPGAADRSRPGARCLPGHRHVVLVDGAATERTATAAAWSRRGIRLHGSAPKRRAGGAAGLRFPTRSEEHTSELQSPDHL